MAKNRQSAARRGRLVILLIVLAGAAGAWVIWGEGLRSTARAGTAYGARVACSCRFVAGRSLADCTKDKLAGMGLVHFSEDEDGRSVTASVPLVASDTARLRDGYGCVLDPWDD